MNWNGEFTKTVTEMDTGWLWSECRGLGPVWKKYVEVLWLYRQ